jgi:proteasome lid subunit RPN8/RPN11
MEHKISTKSISSIKNFIVNHSFNNSYVEICGFVGFDEKTDKYIATIEKNIAQDPRNFFAISPVKYLNFKKDYDMIGIFHSHIIGDENPSEFDIKMSDTCCLPFIIYSLNSKNFYFYEPHYKDYNVKTITRFKDKLL